MSDKNRPQLEPRYYLDHFVEMVDFVRKQSPEALEDRHLKFLQEFENLSLDARCLYVRFANRKGRVFRREQICYREITSIKDTLSELTAAEFVSLPGKDHWPELLALHPRKELVSMIKNQTQESPPSSWPKRKLLEFAEANLTFENCFSSDSADQFVLQERSDELEFLLFLYHGKLSSGLTAMTLRDLGLINRGKTRSEFQSRFNSPEAARTSFYLQKINAVLEAPTIKVIRELSARIEDWPLLNDPESELLYHRAVYRLGRELERLQEHENALQVFRFSDQFPSTERMARLLVKLGDQDAAKNSLERMIENPSCDAELLFAEDFYERKFKRRKVGKLTTLLREARIFEIDESNRDRPEAGVISFLNRHGETAVHSENHVWNQLFGLLFWDFLFDSKSAPVHNEFERKPWGLDSGVFYEKSRTLIEKRLALLDHKNDAIEFLRMAGEKHDNTPNQLFSLFPGNLETVLTLVQLAPPEALSRILKLMAKDHRNHRAGFPDLMVFSNEGLRFIEVKTEGDRISRRQLTRIEQLRQSGITVEIGAVKWKVDPEQEYVVVDLETTGGSPNWNRITEIGAVKVVNGRITDEWTSFVNPGRKIMPFVVKLTGITDEMVSEAPSFGEIADEFRRFLGDAVFVAHRVKFDYGILRAEFQKIAQEFRCPTLCTVVTSRRLFPGLKSYGLAKLTKEFGIELDSHHRALCDARATAEILLRINQKRLADQAGL